MRITIFLLISLWGAAAFAQTTPEEQADMHYQSAMQMYSEGRYKESIAAFDSAIALVPESVFYCNRAAVHLELSDVDKALKDLRSCRAQFEGDAEDAAVIDAQTLGLEIGATRVARSARSRTDAVQRAILESNTEQNFGVRGWGLVTLAVGGGAIASAIIVDLLSSQLVEDFVRQSEGRNGTSVERFNELKSQVETRQVIFYTLAISGAVLTTAGLTMVIFGGDSEEEPSAQIRFSPGNVTFYGSF